MAQSNNSHDDLIFKLALVAGGYFFVVAPILEGLGLKKDAERLATEQKNKEQLQSEVDAALAKQKPTKSIAEWKIIADQIYADLRYSSLDDNKEDAGYQVTRVKNDADFILLFQQFKQRREYLFGVPAGALKNLQAFIISNLSAKKIDVINENYRRKGIKYRF